MELEAPNRFMRNNMIIAPLTKRSQRKKDRTRKTVQRKKNQLRKRNLPVRRSLSSSRRRGSGKRIIDFPKVKVERLADDVLNHLIAYGFVSAKKFVRSNARIIADRELKRTISRTSHVQGQPRKETVRPNSRSSASKHAVSNFRVLHSTRSRSVLSSTKSETSSKTVLAPKREQYKERTKRVSLTEVDASICNTHTIRRHSAKHLARRRVTGHSVRKFGCPAKEKEETRDSGCESIEDTIIKTSRKMDVQVSDSRGSLSTNLPKKRLYEDPSSKQAVPSTKLPRKKLLKRKSPKQAEGLNAHHLKRRELSNQRKTTSKSRSKKVKQTLESLVSEWQHEDSTPVIVVTDSSDDENRTPVSHSTPKRPAVPRISRRKPVLTTLSDYPISTVTETTAPSQVKRARRKKADTSKETRKDLKSSVEPAVGANENPVVRGLIDLSADDSEDVKSSAVSNKTEVCNNNGLKPDVDHSSISNFPLALCNIIFYQSDLPSMQCLGPPYYPELTSRVPPVSVSAENEFLRVTKKSSDDSETDVSSLDLNDRTSNCGSELSLDSCCSPKPRVAGNPQVKKEIKEFFKKLSSQTEVRSCTQGCINVSKNDESRESSDDELSDDPVLPEESADEFSDTTAEECHSDDEGSLCSTSMDFFLEDLCPSDEESVTSLRSVILAEESSNERIKFPRETKSSELSVQSKSIACKLPSDSLIDSIEETMKHESDVKPSPISNDRIRSSPESPSDGWTRPITPSNVIVEDVFDVEDISEVLIEPQEATRSDVTTRTSPGTVDLLDNYEVSCDGGLVDKSSKPDEGPKSIFGCPIDPMLFDEEFEPCNNASPVKQKMGGAFRTRRNCIAEPVISVSHPKINDLCIDENDALPLNDSGSESGSSVQKTNILPDSDVPLSGGGREEFHPRPTGNLTILRSRTVSIRRLPTASGRTRTKVEFTEDSVK